MNIAEVPRRGMPRHERSDQSTDDRTVPSMFGRKEVPMFKMILIANRGDKGRGGAGLAAQPNCMVRAAHAGGLATMEVLYV
jgi:hypothetical protein